MEVIWHHNRIADLHFPETIRQGAPRSLHHFTRGIVLHLSVHDRAE